MSPSSRTSTIAMKGPMPGMVVRRRTRGSAPQRVTRSASRRRICASSVGKPLQLALAALGEPALARGRLQVTAREHRLQTITDHAAEPDELDAMADEFTRLAHGCRREPDSGHELATQQELTDIGIDPEVLHD